MLQEINSFSQTKILSQNMGRIKIYQVDAFSDKLFSGNPAAVCLLDEWPRAKLMQSVANENNLAETAFIVPKGNSGFEIRWFTPTVEVDLCGHATLASAFVLFNELKYSGKEINFHSQKSGVLKVSKHNDTLFLDFPTDEIAMSNLENTVIEKCIGISPLEIYRGRTDYIAVVETQRQLQELQPNFDAISKLEARGLIVTAKGDKVDFTSRFFAPQAGVFEDPVTGSAHTSLTPIWAKKLGKKKLTAWQISKRGGQLECELKGERCLIGGNARLYMVGEINME